ncbi:DEAD-box ATP-dependent RNA helicase 13 [Impatiens glandulifera]|uniref:DEAD-box ATP-dependent RNA helicase 13 n=1 Tax=Impatiens glandulifera TaxID=253017 RepID=UPI001FB140C2|nr:DEAD-box ATP-dependent RNA helicase 13 [Impatiens glandulifera]
MASQVSQKKPKKASRFRKESEEIKLIDSLKWNSSIDKDNEDNFHRFIGSDEFDGGFLSLEEIDESEYGLNIPIPKRENKKEKKDLALESKKRKRDEADTESDNEEKLEELAGDIKPKKKKKNKKGKDKKKKGPVENTEPEADNDDCKDNGEELINEWEYYAWNELRLHPLLMKSIYRLGFKEPTPIQKSCIPAAAHQGKDVIGAAETGSGKTLAFGLPILQRLLEEQEKADNFIDEKSEDAVKRIPSEGVLRALIITPTRELALQVTDHLKEVAKATNFRVVPIVGGMSTEKQERLLKSRPEVIVGTPGRLWELMSRGEIHLIELHSLSFFVLDEADRMIENGHFRELQSIIDMLPAIGVSDVKHSESGQDCKTVTSFQKKKRQTFVFSATIALSADFRKKLKHGSIASDKTKIDGINSIETLSGRAGMRPNAAIFDLTNEQIVANKLEESFIECKEEEKDAYLYYILRIHGQGRTIVFCTSIAAVRHVSNLLRILGVNILTLHAQMQQRARLKAMDRFRGNEHGILIATDVAARGLDIPGVRTVVHFQLPHSAEVYVHRSGRTARALADGCSIALISPKEASKFAALCKSFSKETFRRFPIEVSYMPEVNKRLSLARQVDKISRKESEEKAKKTWFEKNAESIELEIEDNESEDEKVRNHRKKKATSIHLKKLQEELNLLSSKPLQPKSFSSRYLAGSGVSPLLQNQFEELAKQNREDNNNGGIKNNKRKLLVMGQDCVEPLEALRNSGKEVMDLKEIAEKRRNVENLKRKRKEEKKRLNEQKRNKKKKLKEENEEEE